MSKELTTSGRPVAVPQLGPEARLALDVALGVAGVTVGAAVVAVRTVHRVTAPVTRLLWRPPLVPRRFHPATIVGDLARTGGADREELSRQVEALLDVWVPAIVAMVVAAARPHPAGRGQRRPRPDRLDRRPRRRRRARRPRRRGAAGRPRRDRVSTRRPRRRRWRGSTSTPIVATVDLTPRSIDRVDLDAVVATVDLDAAVARVDLDAVIDRIDVIGIVEEVLDVIDLPAIIRDSTGSMASETVRGARMTSITADDAISRAVDRALFRRAGTGTGPEASPRDAGRRSPRSPGGAALPGPRPPVS